LRLESDDRFQRRGIEQQPLGQSDIERREVILEKFRKGEPTGAIRATEESGAISQAVD
jgi:pilus assembly protein CpaD